jgi:hypothetical protein
MIVRCSTSDDQAVAVGHSVEPGRWQAETDRLLDRMAGRFARVETRRRARKFVLGLLADLPRKNCWTIAEPDGDKRSARDAASTRRPRSASGSTWRRRRQHHVCANHYRRRVHRPHGPRTAVAVLTEALQRLLYGDLDTSRHAGHID